VQVFQLIKRFSFPRFLIDRAAVPVFPTRLARVQVNESCVCPVEG